MKNLLARRLLPVAILTVLSFAICAGAAGATAADSYEPDDTLSAAVLIDADGTTQTHSLFPADDADWLKFDAVEGESYAIDTLNLSPEADTNITLFDAEENEISSNNDGGPGLASSTGFTAPASGTYYIRINDFNPDGIGDYDIRVSPGGSISGEVNSGEEGPLADINVSVYRYDAEMGWWDWVVDGLTGPDGAYSVGGLGTGTYRVGFTDWSGAYAAEYFEDRLDVDTGGDVPVTAGEDSPGIDAVLALAGSITGTVTNDSSAPLSGVNIGVYRYNDIAGSWDWFTDGVTEADGAYIIGGLPTGAYRVGFFDWTGIHENEYYNDQPYVESGTDVAVTSGLPTAGVDAALVADVTAPITISTADPADPDGANSWYLAPPSIMLSRFEEGTTFYQWDSTSPATWDSSSTDPFFVAPSEGDHTLYYYSVDLAGNPELVQASRFKIDTGLPVDPATVISPSHTIDTTSIDRTIEIDFSPGTDTASGVEGYSITWSHGATETPPEDINMAASAVTTETTVSPFLDGGNVWFNLRTRDEAGHWTATVHLGPFVLGNLPPELGAIGDKTVDEGELLSFEATATDLDGDVLAYSTSGLPAGATLDAAGGAFNWTPGYDQSGTHTVTFEVSDGADSDTETIEIVVNNVNRAPVLDPIGDKSVGEGAGLAFTVTATDPDGDALTYSASGLPTGATFDTTSGAFEWTPGYDQSGTYQIDVLAGDGDLTAATETVNIIVDQETVAPTGSVVINGGGVFTNSTAVTLSLSAADVGDGLGLMRFKNEGGAWSAWEPYASTRSWSLAPVNGDSKVWAQYKDNAGNESAEVSDSIFLDTEKPAATMWAPSYSTKFSTTSRFTVTWGGTDPPASSGLAPYDVRYKVGTGGSWIAWKTETTLDEAIFKGTAGRTYYFSVRAKDMAGNVGDWSAAAATIVPYNESANIKAMWGFNNFVQKAGSEFYRGTVRYSTISGEGMAYEFTGKSVALISTKGKNRSKANIYIDGSRVATVDAYSPKLSYRKVLFSKKWSKGGKHTIEIFNFGNRRRFDIDAIAVGR